jgi:hypothetical protein
MKIANILITNNWSVSTVFGHPDILELCPEYDDQQNVMII